MNKSHLFHSGQSSNPLVDIWPLEWARIFLLKNKDKLKAREKFAVEIAATFILGRCLQQLGTQISGIGYPIKDDIKRIDDKWNYCKVAQSILQDSDFDTILHMGLEEHPAVIKLIKLQVVRYNTKHLSPEEELLDFLRKRKFKHYATDDGLHLLVWVDSTYNMNFREMSSSLQSESVPFGSIVLVGSIGSGSEKPYACIRLFPDLEGPFVIALNERNK